MATIEQEKIKKLLRKDNPTVLEIGAHKGEDALRFLQEFKDIKIYCFEPDPRCTAEFKKTVKDNRCVLMEAAVSNRDGETILNMPSSWRVKVPKLFKAIGAKRYWTFMILAYRQMRGMQRESTGQSSIKKSLSHSKKYPWLTFKETVMVKTIKLDTWVQENNIRQIDFIWMDVQGAERDVIEGAANTLKIVKYLYTEYGETSCYPDAMTREETIRLLQKNNFQIIPECSSEREIGNLLFLNRNFA